MLCFNLAHLAAGEGQLPCLKYLVSAGVNPMHVLGARNDQGETPKDLAQQFYKDVVVEYINGIEWERDHPEEAESKYSPTPQIQRNIVARSVYTDTNKQVVACTDRYQQSMSK